MSTRFAIIETSNTNRVGNGSRLWVRRIEMSKRRDLYGLVVVKVTRDADKALTWATREAAERRAAEHTTDWRTLAVVEVQV